MIAIGVIRAMLDRDDHWAYRIPFALQWMWHVPLFIGIAFAPESPWWLVRKGRIADAKKSLLRLTSLDRDTGFDADETISMMVHTTSLEKKIADEWQEEKQRLLSIKEQAAENVGLVVEYGMTGADRPAPPFFLYP